MSVKRAHLRLEIRRLVIKLTYSPMKKGSKIRPMPC